MPCRSLSRVSPFGWRPSQERELAPFSKIRDNHPKFLLTLDEDPSDNIDGTRKLNVLDWLLQ